MNGQKLLAGKSGDRSQFWLDGDANICEDNGFVATHEIKIQNGKIIESACDFKGE